MSNSLAKGTLLIIGGAEDKKDKKKILREAVRLAGEKSNFAVITTATMEPESVGEEYIEVFKSLGAKDVRALNIDTREDANKKEYINIINNASAIFFTGGDQVRITSIIGGSLCQEALSKAYINGAVIIGTSAGASVMSRTMIVDGDSNDTARKCTLSMAPGLGLFSEAIVDQHFAQRGRIGRLLCAVAENPEILGIGIDEDTAIKVTPDKKFYIIGTNSVTVIDGRTIKTSNVSELNPNEILSINNATLHVLPEGYGYDIRTREVFR